MSPAAARALPELAALLLAASAARAAGAAVAPPRSVLDGGALARFAAGRPELARIAMQEREPHTVVRVAVPEKTANPWDLQVLAKSTAAVARGDRLELRLWLRAAAGDSARIVAKLQDRANASLIRTDVAAGAAWQPVALAHVAAADYAPGELAVALFLGIQAQEIELGGLDLVAAAPDVRDAGPAAPAAPAAPGADPLAGLAPLDAATPRFVLFKLDDLKAGSGNAPVHPRFQRVADFLKGRSMRAGFGIVGMALETTNAAFFAWIRTHADANGGPFEFWHHGYDHKLQFEMDGVKHAGEFGGPSIEYQREHFAKAQDLMRARTGLEFRTFGAPGNANDASTARVLEERPEILVWLYGDGKAKTTKLVLGRTLNLEAKVGAVDFEAFAAKYPAQRGREYLVLQGHPGMWTDESFAAFQRIVDLLAADRWRFVTPCDYQAFKSGAAAAAAGRTPPPTPR